MIMEVEEKAVAPTMCREELYFSLWLHGEHEDVGKVWTGGGVGTGGAVAAEHLVGRQETIVNNVRPICEKKKHAHYHPQKEASSIN